jgi:hypothetical protein
MPTVTWTSGLLGQATQFHPNPYKNDILETYAVAVFTRVDLSSRDFSGVSPKWAKALHDHMMFNIGSDLTLPVESGTASVPAVGCAQDAGQFSFAGYRPHPALVNVVNVVPVTIKQNLHAGGRRFKSCTAHHFQALPSDPLRSPETSGEVWAKPLSGIISICAPVLEYCDCFHSRACDNLLPEPGPSSSTGRTRVVVRPG